MDIGGRVRERRKSRNLSQEALARRAGVTLNAISQLERGVSNDPHYSTLVGIAEALGVSVGELVGEPILAGKAEAPTYTGHTGEELEPSLNDVLGEERRVRAFLAAHPSEEERVQALEKAASSIGGYNERWRAEVDDIEERGIFPYGRGIEMRALWKFISDAMDANGIRGYTGRIDAGRLEASDEEQAAINRLRDAWMEMSNLVNRMREVERKNRESANEEIKRGLEEQLEDFLSEALEETEKQRAKERPQAR